MGNYWAVISEDTEHQVTDTFNENLNMSYQRHPTRGASPPPSLRAQYDLQSTTTIKKPLTRENVNMALTGLDRAEDFVAKNQLTKALDMYLSCLEVLVRAASEGVPGLDRKVLKESASLAMNEAEVLKERIKKEEERRGVLNRSRGVQKSNSTRSIESRNCAVPIRRNRSAEKSKPSRRIPSVTSRLDPSDPMVQTIQTEILLQSPPKVNWSDISGLSDAKRSLQEAIILPILRPDLYTGLRSPPRGILLYGPPGTGKTMLAKAAANESQCHFFSCSASSLTSKWFGEGEKLLRTLFRFAGVVSPSIIFFDEIDAVLSARKSEEHEASRRFKTEFMVQVDGVVSGQREEKVLILGCTNCPWDLDDAVIRRFQRRIYVPLPDMKAREAMMDKLLSENANSLSKKDVGRVVKMTEGYSCSDLSAVGREAAFGPLRDLGGLDAIRGARMKDLRPISFQDFKDAVGSSGKSVSAGLLKRYEEWEREQGGGE